MSFSECDNQTANGFGYNSEEFGCGSTVSSDSLIPSCDVKSHICWEIHQKPHSFDWLNIKTYILHLFNPFYVQLFTSNICSYWKNSGYSEKEDLIFHYLELMRDFSTYIWQCKSHLLITFLKKKRLNWSDQLNQQLFQIWLMCTSAKRLKCQTRKILWSASWVCPYKSVYQESSQPHYHTSKLLNRIQTSTIHSTGSVSSLTLNTSSNCSSSTVIPGPFHR